MKQNLDLCMDCKDEPPLYAGGVMYKRCAECLNNLAIKKRDGRAAKQRRLIDSIREARK